MNSEPTYIFKEGKVYTYLNNKVIASVSEEEFVEEQAAHFASTEGATHVMTPNGLKGKILGHVKGLWDDEVTVRFENGRVSSLPVSKLTFAKFAEDEDEKDEIHELEEKVKKPVDSHEAAVIEARVRELDQIKAQASALIDSKLSDKDLLRVGSVISQANYELDEINDVIQGLEEQRYASFEAPAPFKINVVEQGGPTGGRESNWLDAAIEEMVHEANSTNYSKLMDEGPEAFVAGLDREMLADAGTVRAAASDWIRSKTAAADDDVRDKYERIWLARVEEQRRSSLSEVKDNMRKKASSKQSFNYDVISDDSLFI